MSGMFPTDKPYFSFNLPAVEAAGLDTDWLAPRVRRPLMRGLLPAVLVSLLAHIFLLPWLFSLYETIPSAYISKPGPIHLTIKYLHPGKPVAAEPLVAELPHPDIIAAPPTLQTKAQTAVVSAEVLPAELLPESVVPSPVEPQATSQGSIDSTQLRSLIQQTRLGYDADLPLSPTDGYLEKSQGSRQFNNVFHPGLRQKLQKNTMHHSQAKYEAGGESTDVYGSTFVEINEADCFMTVAGGAGDPTDWYHTRCAGFKGEGEEIMQRVNGSLRKTQ